MKRYDIGLYGLWFGHNYGSILTYFFKNGMLEQKNRELMKKISALTKEIDLLKKAQDGFRMYSNPARLGMPKGAGIVEIYNKLPQKSVLIADCSEFGSDNFPSRYGFVHIVKISKARSSIRFFSKENGFDAKMYLKPNGEPSGVWIFESKV